MLTLFKTLGGRRSIGETKVLLKAENKRLRKHSMLFIVLFAFLLPVSNANQPSYNVFESQYIKIVDITAIRTCHTLGGSKIEEVEPGNPEKGHKCTVELQGSTETQQQAREHCESRIPFYIIGAKPADRSVCTFQINLRCANDYWQIRGKCYKVSTTKYTWQEAEKICNVEKLKGRNPRIAEYYYEGLNNYLRDILNIYDAWVYVPELKDYFANANGNAAFYVQQGAYKYDSRPGDILMDELTEKHQVLCEYTPEMTMAELFYIGTIYSEIYPLAVYHSGAVIPSGNLETIEHKETINGKPRFSADNLNEKCMSVGKILNVESYPITPIQGEFNDVKDYLKDQRFYLTSAYNHDGCKKVDYRHKDKDGNEFPMDEDKITDGFCKAHSYSISQSGRYATMASMRAPVLCTLHTFKWKFGACPSGPAWFESPISYKRDNGQIFCHYISNREFETRPDAVAKCESFGAALSGFDSPEEFALIRNKAKPEYPSNAFFGDRKAEYPTVQVRVGGRLFPIDYHYWLGGISPCEVNCDSRPGKTEAASWDKGVALNTIFLNDYKHAGWTWITLQDFKQFVTFRQDNDAFHVHKIDDPYKYMFYICGITAPLERGERQTAKPK